MFREKKMFYCLVNKIAKILTTTPS